MKKDPTRPRKKDPAVALPEGAAITARKLFGDPFTSPVVPRTICAKCVNCDELYSFMPTCIAAVQGVDKVSGQVYYLPCVIVNNGECQKYVECKEPESAPDTTAEPEGEGDAQPPAGGVCTNR